MSNDERDTQEDWVFDKLDGLLDTATWRRGQVILKPNKSIIYCYNLDALRRELTEIARYYATAKFKPYLGGVDDIVANILEEYEVELTKYNIIKSRRTDKQASKLH